jgi:hypothetical protein
VLDARVAFGEPFSRAIRAQFAALPNGETVLLAVFKDSAEAGAAWGEYLRRTGLGRVRGEGDLDRGYAVTRPVGDRALALRLHNTLGVWTGASDAAIRRRMQAGGFAVPGPVPPTPPPPITPG